MKRKGKKIQGSMKLVENQVNTTASMISGTDSFLITAVRLSYASSRTAKEVADDLGISVSLLL